MNLTPEQYKNLRHRFHIQRVHAGVREIEWDLSFEDWLAWWMDSGHLHERGSKPDEYCMARHGDTGPYALDNIKCITNRENHKEKTWVPTADQRKRMSEAAKAREAKKRTEKAAKKDDTRRPCVVDGVRYPSVNNAASKLKLTPRIVLHRINYHKHPQYQWAKV